MSNTPNPGRKRELTGTGPKLWRRGDRVHTTKGSMSLADYELLRAARPDVLPRLDSLPRVGTV